MIRFMDKHKNTLRDFKGFDDYIEVFKAGTRTDSQGRTKTFTTADLDQVVANHDPEHPAPHVITHKEVYSPFAYAQSADVKREGDSLLVKADKVEPQFEKLVRDGRLYERSVRLMPTDKGWKLGHVAWLGAEPPAVEGLAPLQFESGQEFYDFEMDSYTPNAMARLFRRVREFIVDKFDIETADKVIPDYEIESLSDHATRMREKDNEDSSTSFTQHTGDETMPDFTQADIDAARQEAADEARKQAKADFARQEEESQNALREERNKRLSAEFNAEVKGWVDAGKTTPAQAEGMAEFMLQLSDGEDAHFEFSAGEGDKKETLKKSPLEWFREFAQSLGKQVDTGRSDAGDELDAGSHNYTAPQNSHVDADRLELHNKALDYQKTHDVDYIDAVRAVEQQES